MYNFLTKFCLFSSSVDVRNPEQVKVPARIGNAINIPNANLISDLQLENEAFYEKYHIKLPADGSPIIFHCNTGKGSGNLLNKIETEHADLWKKYNFNHFEGGVKLWKENNGQVTEI